MSDNKKDKVVVSMDDLNLFLDLLVMYGRERDFIEIENSAWALKEFFMGEDKWLKQDLAAWSEGQISYKENEDL